MVVPTFFGGVGMRSGFFRSASGDGGSATTGGFPFSNMVCSGVVQGRLGSPDIDEAYRTLYGTLLRLACERASDGEIDAIEAAVDDIEAHQATDTLAQRIDSASRFFSAIAAAGHNEALTLMAQTMTTVLRERMTHVPVRPRPDLFPLRRKVVRCLRARDADGAAAALDELIDKLRKGSEAQAGTDAAPAEAR